MRKKTKVDDVAEYIPLKKWNWVVLWQNREIKSGRNVQYNEDKENPKEMWGRPQRRQVDDIRQKVGRRWLQTAQDQFEWNVLQRTTC